MLQAHNIIAVSNPKGKKRYNYYGNENAFLFHGGPFKDLKYKLTNPPPESFASCHSEKRSDEESLFYSERPFALLRVTH
jgi:hypothetical protein